VLAPSVGGAVILARGRPIVDAAPRETIVRGERATILVSACCAAAEPVAQPAAVSDVLARPYLTAAVERARLADLGVPADRLDDLVEAAAQLMHGNFEEGAQILASLTASPYRSMPVVSYMDALVSLGTAAFGRPRTAPGAERPGIDGLPAGRQIDQCLDLATAQARPALGRGLRIPASVLRALPPRLSEALQRCEVTLLRAAGDHRGALESLRRNFADPLQADDGETWLLLENIALLHASGEQALAQLYRDRLEASWRRSGLPVDLRPYQSMPQVGDLLSPSFTIELVARRGLGFGDPALTARVFRLAIDRAGAAELRATLLHFERALAVVGDPRLGAYVAGGLARRLLAARDELLAGPDFPTYFALGRLLPRPGLGAAAPALALLAAAYAAELGLADEGLDRLDMVAAAGALGPADAAWLDGLMRAAALQLAEAAPIGEVVAQLDRRWGQAGGAVAARWPALRHELQVGAVRDAAGLAGDGARPESRAAASEAALLERIRGASFEAAR